MRHWRQMTWVLVLWLAIGVAGFASVASVIACEGLTDTALYDCRAQNAILGVVGMFWLIGAVILAAIWSATRPGGGPWMWLLPAAVALLISAYFVNNGLTLAALGLWPDALVPFGIAAVAAIAPAVWWWRQRRRQPRP